MGIWAAKSAVLVASRLGLSDKAARCLIYMALEVLDTRNDERAIEARRYYGGRDALAISIGYIDESAGSAAARSAVKRAMAQLVDSDVVQVYRVGSAGYRSEYYLRLRSDGVASSEVLQPLESVPALTQGTARRTPVRKTSNGLRTRSQRETDTQIRSIVPAAVPGVVPGVVPEGPPSGPQGVRPTDLQGSAQRAQGVRPAPEVGPPSGPPNRKEQEEQDEQNLISTRAREARQELKDLELRLRARAV